ncbi:MAG: Rne/Rng family ribonuclease, partial [Thermoanaerobaculia bacterium]|nr:Rne/Rng family ribonuclease [Thermoanaerobaculia bacterium]
MIRRMLINAQSREEVRIAVLDDQTLENYQIETAEAGLTRGNIYRGVIANLQSALDAAFVDYGVAKNGFLTLQDVVPEARYKEPSGAGRPRIDEILERGKPIVVQVERDPEGQKGAILTTNLSFAGRYLVLTPFDATRGVSRKVEDDETRAGLREIVHKLELPDGCGVIVRTNALDQTRAELQRDLAALLRVWKRVQQEAVTGKGAKLLYSDQDLLLRALRDHLDTSVAEVLVDDDDAFERAQEYMGAFMPRSKTELVRYAERVPLFSKYGVESQIERIFGRTVQLPSGGAIVIDPTEALTAVDVNSGKSSGGGSHEEMALRTNLEAAREAVRQLRLRDLGGLVVIDFIDLRSPKNRRLIEKEVKEGLKSDRARSSVGRISSNGLLEINRQKIQRALPARAHRPCPTCAGTGRVPSIESIGLNLLRRIEGRAATGRLMKAKVELHYELAEAIQNDRRRELSKLEEEFGIEIEIVASHRLLGPEEQIEWRDRPVAAGPAPMRPAEPLHRKSAPPAAPSAPVVFEITPTDDDEEPAAEGAAAANGDGERGGKRRRRRGGRKRKRRNGEAPAGAAGDAAPAAGVI